MATRGRKPVPTELRVLRGNPRQKTLPKTPLASKPDSIPQAPSDLGEAGRADWTLYWTHGRTWLAMTDAPTLATRCRLADRARALEQRIDEESLVAQVTGKRSTVHPLFNDLRGLYKQMTELESLLGFTPTDRARLRAEAPAEDPLDQWERRTG